MNNQYEAMAIVKPDLSEEERKLLFSQMNDAITKREGSVISAAVWAERRKLYFKIKRCTEGLFYLLVFTAPPQVVKDIRQAYRLNEFILRTLITAQ